MPTSSSFHDVLFPVRISFRAGISAERQTEIVALASGFEERNTRWADSRRSFDAGQGVRNLDDLHEILSFFEERRGELYGFRWRDRIDNRSCQPSKAPTATDQVIGTGDGERRSFQLLKTYGEGPTAYQRIIQKPRPGTVRIAVDGAALSEGLGFSVDGPSGAVRFLGSPPKNGAILTAGYEFDVPVRFATARLDINLNRFDAGEIPSIPLLEVKL